MMTAKLAHITTRRASISGDTIFTARVRLYAKFGHVGAFTGIGDTREAAEADALQWAKEQLAREGLQMPEVENIGKVTRFKFDRPAFG